MSAATRVNQARNLHLPLSEALHRDLLEESARSGRPATAIVREAVEAYLRERRRAAVHEQLGVYAARWAASPIDLDETLETVAAEHLRAPRRGRK
jgi:hypothetical protein